VRSFPISLALALTAALSTPAFSETIECLRSNISAEAIGFDRSVIEGREIVVSITNNLDIPLGGVWVDFQILSSDRPLPLYEASIREAATIDGGLLPGESLLASDFHFMNDRTKTFAIEATELTIELIIQNAADVEMRGFLEHPAMGNWEDQETSEECQ
jgi:hypothetical protein